MRTAKFDKIVVGEMSVSFLTTPAPFSAKAAFVSSETGSTYGWTECTNWSEETRAKLNDLRASMEADLEKIHFDGGATTATPTPIAYEGLGEALGNVPQG